MILSLSSMTYHLVGNCGKSSQDSYVLFLQLSDSNYFKRKVKSKQNPKTLPKPKPINLIIYIQIIFIPIKTCELVPLYIFSGHLELVFRAQLSFPTQAAQAPAQACTFPEWSRKAHPSAFGSGRSRWLFCQKPLFEAPLIRDWLAKRGPALAEWQI